MVNHGALRFLLILLVVAGFSLAIVFTYRWSRVDITSSDDGFAVGQWESLSDLQWESANTAWVAVANEGVPLVDKSFNAGPLSIAGEVYERGIGTYPLSEIEYRLDGEYLIFETEAGVDDSVPEGRGGVIFQVYMDGAMVYSSGPMKSGEPPIRIRLPLLGIGVMRLVAVDATEGAVRNYANWVEARVLKRLVTVADVQGNPILSVVRERSQQKKDERKKDGEDLAALARTEIVDLKKGLGGQETVNGIAGGFDEKRKLLLLSNSKLGIELGYGGNRHGYLTILDLEASQLVLFDGFASATFNDSRAIALPADTAPVNGGFRFESVDDAALGPGTRLEAEFKAKDEATAVVAEIVIFPGSRYLIYRLRLKDVVFVSESSPIFQYFTGTGGDSLVVGEDVEWLTDFSRLRRSHIYDDGIIRKERVSQGKPVFVWSNQFSRGLLLAALDDTESAPTARVQLAPGRTIARFGYMAAATKDSLSSPRLYLEVTDSIDTRLAFANFKRVFAALYPPIPVPAWVKYQWLSWYAFYMDINEEALREQIDYIADNLADLGPWHIIIDAGWYVAEGRTGAEWRSVDYDKFPNGLRSLVDYAHFRGVKVVLYFSTPYIDSREEAGDWLGLKGIIENHRDWLLPIGGSEGRESFVYDYTNPALRAYLREVMRDYFVRYDVDGIKVDGLGNAGGALLDPDRLDAFGMVDRVVEPTMEIYRFTYDTVTSLKDDVYVETGWLTPLFANQYAHTFRYGDEANEFTSVYPFPGLVEHVEYAQVQKMLLGQRANMGALRGDPNTSLVNRWMLEAGLALGTQVVLSFYLPNMSDEALSFYRSLLYHYDAFEGETRYGSSLYADTFATTVRGTTYLGVLNSGSESKEFHVQLSDFDLSSGHGYTVYNVEEGTYARVRDSLDVTLRGHSFALFIIRADSGVMWTNSSVDYGETDTELVLKVSGPRGLPGFVHVLVPRHGDVFFDGVRLDSPEGEKQEDGTYQYDPETGIVSLSYDHNYEHEIRIRK